MTGKMATLYARINYIWGDDTERLGGTAGSVVIWVGDPHLGDSYWYRMEVYADQTIELSIIV